MFEHKDFIIWSSTLFPLNSVYLKKYLSINKDAVYNYFQVGCVPSPLSIFNNVKKISPGETLEIDIRSLYKKNHISNFYEKKVQILNSKKDIINISNDLINSVKKNNF